MIPGESFSGGAHVIGSVLWTILKPVLLFIFCLAAGLIGWRIFRGDQ